ncbi:MAG: hypothetical protein KDB03_04995 [Planctomycetales bacterium]|nr:hypothetical protein [Planctomycetales bacterium]
MAVERRSLVAAVSNNPVPGADPEMVRSFVTQNQQTERPVAAPVVIEPKSTIPKEEPKNSVDTKLGARPKKKQSRFQPTGLTAITVRLRPEIAGALKRASLERQLEGQDVFTQQDLVEQALEPWLREEGYLS